MILKVSMNIHILFLCFICFLNYCLFQTTIIAVTLIVWIEGILGLSYSNVYFQQNTQPLNYLEYGAPPVSYGSQVARSEAAPVGSVVPQPQTSNFVGPCIVPCVYPGQSVDPVDNARIVTYNSPVASADNARLVTYNSPNVPVVVAASNDVSMFLIFRCVGVKT